MGVYFCPQHHAGGVVDDEILVDLVLMESPDVGGGHAQGGEEILPHSGKGFVDFRLGHQQAVQVGAVKLFGVLPQGFVTPGAHIGDNAVHNGFHIGFGTDVPVQDLLRLHGIKRKNTDHTLRASFILASSSVSWRYLNW